MEVQPDPYSKVKFIDLVPTYSVLTTTDAQRAQISN